MYHFFLDSTYKGYHKIFLLLCLTYFTQYELVDREGEISYDIPYTWNLKRNDTNEFTKQRFTDLENKLMVARKGVSQGHVQVAILKMYNQQEPTV